MELLDSIHKKILVWGRIEHLAIKLNMIKAYDSINWSYLEFMLPKLLFAEQFIRLIMKCVSTISISILINGEPSPWTYPSQGLR